MFKIETYAFLKTLAKIRFFFDIRKARSFSACVRRKLLYHPVKIGLKQTIQCWILK